MKLNLVILLIQLIFTSLVKDGQSMTDKQK